MVHTSVSNNSMVLRKYVTGIARRTAHLDSSRSIK